MWSKLAPACRGCGTVLRSHLAKGFCDRCYNKLYRLTNSQKIKASKAVWYYLKGGKDVQKEYRDHHRFAGAREEALQRDGHRCRTCGATEDLVVHHKDGAGRNRRLPNNHPDNLIALCRPCHATVHNRAAAAKKKALRAYTIIKKGAT